MQMDPRWELRDRDDIRFYRIRFLELQKTVFMVLTRVFIIIFIAYVTIIYLTPTREILQRYGEILQAEAEGMKRLPNLQNQIDTLQKQLTALTSESIENRLLTIEQAIRIGDIKPDEIATLQELKQDLSILKTYMFRDASELVELKQLQKNYQEIRENQEKFILKEDVMREVTFLHNLFYASIGMFGLLLAVTGGSWWFSNKKLKQFTEELQASHKKAENQNESKPKNP